MSNRAAIRIVPSICEPVYPPPETRRANKHLAWTPRELQVLRERYRHEGLAACMALLPERNRTAVLAAAARLGLSRQRKHRRWPKSTPQMDAMIRERYRSGPEYGAVKDLAARLGREPGWVSARAQTLGVVRPRKHHHAWTEEEDRLIGEAAERGITLSAIANLLQRQGYTRSAAAVGLRLRRREIDLGSPDGNILTADSLAKCMGVSDQTILRWIRQSGLPATRNDSGHWQIRIAPLRAWLIRRAEWDHRTCNREWLIDILAGGKMGLGERG